MLRIVGSPTTVVRGIELDEIGIVARQFQVRYYPEVDQRFQNFVGETFLRSVSQKFSREVTCEGEVRGTGGIMAFTLGVACTFANDVADFGPTGGTLLLDEATITQTRGGWRSVSVRASSNPLL